MTGAYVKHLEPSKLLSLTIDVHGKHLEDSQILEAPR